MATLTPSLRDEERRFGFDGAREKKHNGDMAPFRNRITPTERRIADGADASERATPRGSKQIRGFYENFLHHFAAAFDAWYNSTENVVLRLLVRTLQGVFMLLVWFGTFFAVVGIPGFLMLVLFDLIMWLVGKPTLLF